MTGIETAVSIFAIASPIVGWGLIYWRSSQKRTESDTTVHSSIAQIKDDVADLKAKAAYITEIKTIKEDVADIKAAIGNGAFHGIRQDIIEIKLTCAREMAALTKQASFNSQRIEKMEKSG